MNALSTEFMGANFKVLGFPCNNFNLQEPGANYSEILNGIKYVRPGGGFVPNFQMFKKIDVNGKDEHPLYTYLKSMCGPTSDTFEDSSMLYYEPKMVSDVRWNFEVFLINKDGHPLYRYSPDAPISDIEFDIRQLLNVRKSSTSDEQPIVKSHENPLETESVESTSTSEDREENTNEIDLEEYVPNPEEMKDTEAY